MEYKAGVIEAVLLSYQDHILDQVSLLFQAGVLGTLGQLQLSIQFPFGAAQEEK